jgi:hypothetical protein
MVVPSGHGRSSHAFALYWILKPLRFGKTPPATPSVPVGMMILLMYSVALIAGFVNANICAPVRLDGTKF